MRYGTVIVNPVGRYLDAWDDGSLLDGRWLLEAVGVDAAQEFLLQIHVIEVLAHLSIERKQMLFPTIHSEGNT